MLIYIILGIIQGFTEPIPVSSSGHLVIFKNIVKLTTENNLNFEIFLNFGSFLAIIILFKNDLIELLKDFLLYIKTKKNRYKDGFNYVIYIIIGTIPAAAVGLVINNTISNQFNNIKYVGLALIITSFFLFIIRKLTGYKEDKDITPKDALKIGLFQIIALFPGISRSGATLVGAMLTGLTRQSAFKFSFMLYIPITIATMVLAIKDTITNQNSSFFLTNYILGALFAFITTLITTKWFKKIMLEGKLIYFVYYCLITGTLVTIFL